MSLIKLVQYPNCKREFNEIFFSSDYDDPISQDEDKYVYKSLCSRCGNWFYVTIYFKWEITNDKPVGVD